MLFYFIFFCVALGTNGFIDNIDELREYINSKSKCIPSL